MPDLESLKLKFVADSSSAISNINGLIASTKSLSTAMGSVGTATTTATKSLKNLGSASNTARTSFKGLGTSIASVRLSTVGLIYALRKLTQGLSSCVRESMNFVETMNLFNVSMGDNAIKAGEFAEKVQQVMGIDMAEWMRNQGVFQTLIEGFGVASEKADIMSQQVTQLGYDLSSLFNLPFAESMQKLQSGIAGELEPLRRLGFDLSQAKLQQIAYDHGIQQSIQTMTQAEKVQLRYYAIMTQVTTAHGDMARTLYQPANMLRVFKQNVTIAARSIGNLLIPVMQKLLVIGILVARGIAKVASAIGSFFGIDNNGWRNFMDDLNYNGGVGLDDLAEDLDDVGGSAGGAAKKIKEFKKQFLGFDKINNITLPTEPASGGRSGGVGDVGGGGFDLPLPTYDFLQGLTDAFAEAHPKLQKFFDFIANHIEGIITAVKFLGSIIAALLIAKKINDLTGAFAGFGKQIAGVVLVAAGFMEFTNGFVDAWNNGFNEENLTKLGLGVAALAAGLGLLFGPIGVVVGLLTGLAAGIILVVKNWEQFKQTKVGGWIDEHLVQPIKNAYTSVKKWLNEILDGVKLFVKAFKEGWKNLKKIGKDAIQGFLDGLKDKWESVKKWFKDKFKGIIDTVKNIFGIHSPSTVFMDIGINLVAGLLNGIRNKWSVVQDFFSGAVSKIKNFFKDPIGSIKVAIDDSVETAQSIWASLSDSTAVKTLKEKGANIIEGVKDLWQSIKDEGVLKTLAGATKSSWDDTYTEYHSVYSRDVKKVLYGATAAAFNTMKAAYDKVYSRDVYLNVYASLNAAAQSVVDIAKKSLGGLASGGIYKNGRWQPVTTAASGGAFNTGQMFIAREAGPELVGTIGGHTAVMNNNQIVSSVAAGVASANSTQNALLRQLINVVQNGEQEVALEIDGTRFGTVAIRSINKVQRQQGRTLINV